MRAFARPVLVLAALGFLFAAAAASAAGPLRPNGDGTVTDLGTGLVWVADPGFAVSSGFARQAVLPRAEALRLVAAMNAGLVESFGRSGWRLPTERELVRMRALAGGLPRPFGGGRSGIPAVGTLGARGDAVAAWPVLGASVLSGVDGAAILATNSVRLARDTTVVGDIVVNDASPGPTLRPGFELGLDRNSTVTGNLAADSVALDRDIVVSGTVAYNTLVEDEVTAGDLETPLGLPVFALLPPFQTTFPRPEVEDVMVASGQTLTLAPGDYRDIVVNGSGSLVLSGGVYTARSVKATAGSSSCSSGNCRSLAFTGATELRVAERLEGGVQAYIGPSDGSGVSPAEIILYVGGINGANGALGANPPAVTMARNGTIRANLYAPNGTIHLDRDFVVVGALVARDVSIDRNSTVTAASFFANRAPIADPSDAFTDGPAPLVITLSGSDVDGDDLTFSVLTGPSEGSLGAVVQDPPPVPTPRPATGAAKLTAAVTVTETATVTYTPASGDDVEDSFTFEVRDVHGAAGVATVRINPADAPEEPAPPPPTTVVALDGAEQTPKDRAVTITLEGNAPAGVALSFAVVAGSGPAAGTLGAVTPGSETPQRTATVVYTPASGSTGGVGFDFSACGTIASAVVCDTGHVTITVFEPPVEPDPLAPDQTATTFEERAVQITLGSGNAAESGGASFAALPGRLRPVTGAAAFIDGAEIAGNVADANDDGFGDNHNVLPGAAPVFVSAAVGGAGGPGSDGTSRIHIEWDVSGFGDGSNLESARVHLHTHRGTIDSLATQFFSAAGGNGTLEDADFEAGMEAVSGAVMPVPPLADQPLGADGTFTFDVKAPLQAALAAGATSFSVQGRVDESLTGPARGLEVRSSASGNLASFLEPQLEITTPGVSVPTLFTILTLPANGTLRNALGAAITSVPAILPSALVSYEPNLSFVGDDGFSYQAELGSVIDSGIVTITVRAGNCATDPSFCEDGR